CGHATLASAHALWQELKVNHAIIYFNTLSGVLKATRAGNEMTLNFPAYTNAPIAIEDNLIQALGIRPIAVHKAHDDWIVELAEFSDVVQLKPNIAQLAQINCRGIIVTAKGSENNHYDFVSRFFAPRVGVAEDPVTGSAHCKLAPYWSARLGKQEMLAYQASQRGGEIKVRVENDRVYLTGVAVTVIEGNLKDIANNMAGHYILIQDIDCAGVEFHSIGHTSGRPFTGTLNSDNLQGGSYAINNLKIKPKSDLPVGLFVVLGEAQISNLHFYNAHVQGA
ncbi:MAG TPA: PhzF family phenazine biosynthesis protein, partial [Gammaproteobacteria bacterium]|nr:PhzF family phenazine biosynthesis protein [Gammaproteobacteria bacterium]